MSYAKVIFPYQTGVIGDLQLQIDDIIEVNYIGMMLHVLFVM
jgi:hypothetical protein